MSHQYHVRYKVVARSSYAEKDREGDGICESPFVEIVLGRSITMLQEAGVYKPERDNLFLLARQLKPEEKI